MPGKLYIFKRRVSSHVHANYEFGGTNCSAFHQLITASLCTRSRRGLSAYCSGFGQNLYHSNIEWVSCKAVQ